MAFFVDAYGVGVHISVGLVTVHFVGGEIGVDFSLHFAVLCLSVQGYGE